MMSERNATVVFGPDLDPTGPLDQGLNYCDYVNAVLLRSDSHSNISCFDNLFLQHKEEENG